MSSSNASNRSVNRINAHPGSAQQSQSVGWTSAGGSLNHPLKTQYSTTGDHSNMEDRPAGAEGGGTGTGAAPEHQEQGEETQDDPCKITIRAEGSDGHHYEDTLPNIGLSVWFHLKQCQNYLNFESKLKRLSFDIEERSNDNIVIRYTGSTTLANNMFMSKCREVHQIIREHTEKYCHITIIEDEEQKDFIVRNWTKTGLSQSRKATAHRARSGCVFIVAENHYRNDVDHEVLKLKEQYKVYVMQLQGDVGNLSAAEGNCNWPVQPEVNARYNVNWEPGQELLEEEGGIVNVLLQTTIPLTSCQQKFLDSHQEAKNYVVSFFNKKDIQCAFDFNDRVLVLTAKKEWQPITTSVLEDLVSSSVLPFTPRYWYSQRDILGLMEEKFQSSKGKFMFFPDNEESSITVVATNDIFPHIYNVIHMITVDVVEKTIDLDREQLQHLLLMKKWKEFEPLLVDISANVVLIRTLPNDRKFMVLVLGTNAIVEEFCSEIEGLVSSNTCTFVITKLPLPADKIQLLHTCPAAVKFIEQAVKKKGYEVRLEGKDINISSHSSIHEHALQHFQDLIISETIMQQDESVSDLLTLDELKDMLIKAHEVHQEKIVIVIDKMKQSLTLTGTVDIFSDVRKHLREIQIQTMSTKTEEEIHLSADHMKYIQTQGKSELETVARDVKVSVKVAENHGIPSVKLTGLQPGVKKVKEWLIKDSTVMGRKKMSEATSQVFPLQGLMQKLLKTCPNALCFIQEEYEKKGYRFDVDPEFRNATIIVTEPEDLSDAKDLASLCTKKLSVDFGVKRIQLTPTQAKALLCEHEPEYSQQMVLHANDAGKKFMLIGTRDIAGQVIKTFEQILYDHAYDSICLYLVGEENSVLWEQLEKMMQEIRSSSVAFLCTSEKVQIHGAKAPVRHSFRTLCSSLAELKQNGKIQVPPRLRMCDQDVSQLIHLALQKCGGIRQYLTFHFEKHGFDFELSDNRLRLYAGSITALQTVREVFESLILERNFSLLNEAVVQMHGMQYVARELVNNPSWEGKLITHTDDKLCQLSIVCTDDIKQCVEVTVHLIKQLYQEQSIDVGEKLAFTLETNSKQIEDELSLREPDLKDKFRIFSKEGKIHFVAATDCIALVKKKLKQMLVWQERQVEVYKELPSQDLRLTELELEFIMKPEVVSYIDDKLVLYQFKLSADCKSMSVCCIKKSNLDRAVAEVKDCIKRTIFDMSNEPLLYNLSPEDLKKMLDVQEVLHGGKLLIKVDAQRKRLFMVYTDDVQEVVLSKLEEIKTTCSDMTEVLPFTKEVWDQVKMIYPEDLHTIETEDVKLQYDAQNGLEVTGHKDKVDQAMTKLKTVAQKVHHEPFSFPEGTDILQTQEGQELLRKIEKRDGCMITRQENERETDPKMADKEFLTMLHMKQTHDCVKLSQWTSDRGSTITVIQGSTKDMCAGTLVVPVVRGELPQDFGHVRTDPALREKFENMKKAKDNPMFTDSSHFEGIKCNSVVFFNIPSTLKDGKDKEKNTVHATVKNIIKQAGEKTSSTDICLVFVLETIFKEGLDAAGVKCIIRGAQEAFKEMTSSIDVQLLTDRRNSSDVMKTLENAGKGKVSVLKKFKNIGKKLKPGKDKPSEQSKTLIKIAVGRLEKRKVDVLVNSAHQMLDLTKGVVSRALNQATNGQLQRECTKRFPNGIHPGEVAITHFQDDPSRITSKVFHGVLWQFPHGNQSDVTEQECWQVMQEFIYNCLLEASKLGVMSIAFPILGAGTLKYPAKRVAEVMFDTVEWFISVCTTSSIKLVEFVVYEGDKDIIQVFTSEYMSRSYHAKGFTQGVTARETRHVRGNVMLQFIQSDISKCEGMTDGLICIWENSQLQDPSKHPIVGQHLKTIEWNLYVQEMKDSGLTKTKGDGLPANIIFHTLLTDFKTTLSKGLKCAVDNHCRTVQFGVMAQGKTHDTKSLVADIMNILKRDDITCNDLCLFTVVVADEECYTSIVQQLNKSQGLLDYGYGLVKTGCNIPEQDDPCKITIVATGSDGVQYHDTVPDIGLSVWFHLKYSENEINLEAKLSSANIFTKEISHGQIELSYGNCNPPITNDIFMKNCKTVCEIIKETTDKYCRMNIPGDDKLKEFIVKKWPHTHLFQSKVATAHRAHSGCLFVVAGTEHRDDVHLEIRKLLSEYRGEKLQGILPDRSTVTEQQPRCYGKWTPIQDILKEDGEIINVLLETQVALTEDQLLFLKDKPEAQKCVTKYFKRKEIVCMYNFDDMALVLTADKKLESLPVTVLEEVVGSFTVQLDIGKDAIDGNLLHLIEERFSHCKEFFMMIHKPSDHLLSVIATRPVLKDIQNVMQNVAVKAEKKRIELKEEDFRFLLKQMKWTEYEPVLVDVNRSVVLIRTVCDAKGYGFIVQGTSKNVVQFERGVMQVSSKSSETASIQLTALSHELMLIQRCPEVVKYIEETLGCHLEVRGDNVWISSSTGEVKRAEKTFRGLIVSNIIKQQDESVFDLLTLEELKEMLMENNGVHHDKLVIEVDKAKLTLTGTIDIFPDVIKDFENIKLKYKRTEDFVPMSPDHIECIQTELLLMLDDSRLKVSAILSENGYKLTGSELGVAKVKEWLLHTCKVREKKGQCQVIALGGLTQRLLKESSTARRVILDACEQHGFELQLDDENKSATITVQKPEDLLEASQFFSSYVVTFSVNEKELGHITPFELRSLLLEKNPELTTKVLLHANDKKREIKLIGPKDFALPLFEQLKQILNDYAHDEICLHLETEEIRFVYEKVLDMKSKVSAGKVELCCTSERVEMKGARVHVQSCWGTICEYLTELKHSRKIDVPPKLRMCEQNVSSLIHVALDQNNNIKSYIAMYFDEHGYYFEVSEGRLRLFAGSITALHAVREMFLSLIVEKIFSLADEPVVRINGLKYIGSKLADEPSYEGKMMTHVDDDTCQVRVVCTDDIQDQVEDHFLQIVKMYQEETVDIQVSEHITENLQQLEDDLFRQSPDTKGRFRIFVKCGKICVVADRDCMAMVKTKIEQMVMWKERERNLKGNVPHKDFKLSDLQFEFIQKPVVINYIDNTLEVFEYEIIMVGKLLRIYALKPKTLDKGIRDVLNCLTEENIDMSTDPLPLHHIKDMLDAQVALHGGKLLTEVDQEKKCLKMICTRDVHETVLSKLEGIRTECSDVTHTVALSSAKWQQIRLIYPEELHELGKEVKLEFSNEGIHVTGHHKVVGKAITNLQNLIEMVHVKTFPITDDKCILQAYEGQDLISNIQKSEQCMITVQEHERETTDGVVGKEYLAELHLKLSSSVILSRWTSMHGSSISVVQGSIQNISSENLAVPVVGGELPAEICHIHKDDQSLKRKINQLKKSKQFSITNPSWCKCHSVVFFWVPLSLKDSKNQERESLLKTIKEIIEQTELNKSATCAFFLEALCKKGLQSVGIKSIIRGTQEALKELTHTIDVQLLADENRSSDVIEILKAACPESSKINLWKQFKKLRRKKNLEKGKSSDIDRPPAIKIVSGKLEDQKVDVLVNSVNKELELSRGNVSKALDDATGGLLQKECKRQFSNGIVPGQVAVTSFHGKSTAEQKVYHGVLYCFPRGEQNEPTEEECWKMMCEFIYRCLYEANKEGKESIAFPVLGSGNLRYPPLQVAEVMFDTVEWFFNVHQTSLKRVHFVVYGADRDINKLFTAEWMARNYDIRNIMKGSKARETRHDCGNIVLQIIESDLQMCKGISDGLLCLWKKHQLTDPSKHPIVGKHLESMQWDLYAPELSKTDLIKTTGDGLPANIIFHTVVNTDFRTALYKGLNCAVEMNCRTVQFGLLSQDIPVDIKQFVADILKVLKEGKIASRDLCLVTVVVPNQDCYSSVVAQLNTSHRNYWQVLQDAISFIPGTSARKTESSSPEYASGRPGDETQLVVAGKSEKHCDAVRTHVNDRIRQIQHHSKNSPETNRSDGSSVDGMAPNPLFQDCDERETDDKVFGLCRVKLKPVVTEEKNWSSIKSNLEHIGLELQSYGQHVYAEGSFEALSKAHEQLSKPADKPFASGFEKDVHLSGLTSIVSNVHFEAVLYFIGKTEFEQFCDIEEISDSKKKILFTASQEHKEKVLSLHQRIQRVIQEEVDLSKLDQIQFSNQKAYEVEKTAMSDNRDVYIKYAEDRHVMILFAEDWDKMSRAKKRMMLKFVQGKVAPRGKRRFANQLESTLKTDIKQHGNISFVMESGAAVAEGRSFTVKVYKESIVSLTLDVIVNAANGQLSHGGGVAQIIARAAGPQLEDEGNSIVRRGDIPVTDLAVTNSGNLRCKRVFHAVGPRWSTYTDKERCLEDLCCTILRCLCEAVNRSFKTIAFPSISSSIFAVPKDACAKMYVRALKSFDTLVERGSLKEVHFVDVSDTMVNIIQTELQNTWSQPGKMENLTKDRAFIMKCLDSNTSASVTVFSCV